MEKNMGTRADFYVVKYEKLEWIGSLYKDGHPWNIPTDILIQINPVMFEELTVEFLQTKDSAIASRGDKWPWLWADSRLTDYSYIFGLYEKVVAYSPDAKHLFDPLKIVQGEGLKTTRLLFRIKFPTMLKPAIDMTEELLNQYGLQPAEAI